MATTAFVDVRPGQSGDRQPALGSGAPTNGADVADLPDDARLLASRLVASLDNRPFQPTAAQLAWVWGGDQVRGETRQSRARIAAGRYAGLFADHAVQDVTLDGAPGAYARIWLCARVAFVESMASRGPESRGDGQLSRWENEGGRAA